MHVKHTHLVLILFLSQFLPVQPSFAWFTDSNFSISGNTNKDFNFDFFEHNKYYRDELNYNNYQLKTVVQPGYQVPTSVSIRAGSGYRWITSMQQMLGIYGFFDFSGDVGAGNSQKHVESMPYAGYFARLNIGYEHYLGSTGITINTYVPIGQSFMKLDHHYLNNGHLEGPDCAKIIGLLAKAGRATEEEIKSLVMQRNQDNFYYQDGKRYQKHFYLEEGSYGVDVKFTYNLTQYNTLPFGGVYYFYDSYGNHIVGAGGGVEYRPTTGWSVDCKYSYDSVHLHYIALGAKWTSSHYYPGHIISSNHLLKPVESGLAPTLRRNQAPREVFNSSSGKPTDHAG